MPMTNYDVGTAKIVNHDSDTLTGAFGIPDNRFQSVLDVAESAWRFGSKVSQSIEYVLKELKGSEAVLALCLLGRIWERES